MFNKLLTVIIFILILLMGAYFRLVGNNWDQGQHLHPDERFLTMVATGMSWPKSFIEYFDTDFSKLNPHNTGNGFYVYGTWPVILVKAVSAVLYKDDYTNLTLVGRAMSAAADLLTCAVVYFIGLTITKKYSGGLISMFAYSLFTLPIQLSHFFAVDPYATLFFALAVYFMVQNRYGIFLGIALGLASAAKISGLIIIPFLGISYLVHLIKSNKTTRINTLIFTPLLLISFFLTIRFFYPYLFNASLIPSLNQKVLDNWKQLSSFNDPNTYFPPGVQWISTIPIIFPLLNLLYFGIGLPLGILAITGLIYAIFIKHNKISIILSIIVLIPFIYQGIQFVKALRYFYSIYPIIAVLIGLFLSDIWINRWRKIAIIIYLFISLLWPMAFIHIYTSPNSRVAASVWIYQHIPKNSRFGIESWDDGLPVGLDANRTYSNYQLITLPITGSDTEEKWQQLNTIFKDLDYLLLTSNRGYGSMLSVPDRYPETVKYYNNLFGEKSGFTKVAEFGSRPSIPFPGVNLCLVPPILNYGKNKLLPPICPPNTISIVDDYADETWTVYDHPKVIIYKRIIN